MVVVASMMAPPFHTAPKVFAIFAPFAVVAVGLAVGLLLRRGLDLVLAPDDARRVLIADVIMYGGILLAFAAPLLMHWRQ